MKAVSMSTNVFIVILIAAALHATWNAIVKGGDDKYVGMAAVIIGAIPFALAVLPFVPAPAPESWPYILAGMFLHFGYQIFLLYSYRIGDLTQVYPLARGSAPLLVTAFSVFVLNVDLETPQLIAILLIGAGITSMSLVRQQNGQRNGKAAMLALITGCFIASYSLVDGTGAQVSGTPFGFYSWLAICNAVVFAIFTFFAHPGKLTLMLKNSKNTCLIGGGASFTAYSLIMWAFTQAPIAIVTALRETSIVFALLIGVFVLKEKLDLAKVISTTATLCGAALLRLSK